MLLAFRETAADGASCVKQAAAWLTRERLVSHYCHGGIILNDRLFHANSTYGLHDTDYTPEKWDTYRLRVTPEGEQRVLDLYDHLKGTEYDWFSLLAFAIPHDGIRDSDRLYCFEWQTLALSAALNLPPPRLRRHTPESVLSLALQGGVL